MKPAREAVLYPSRRSSRARATDPLLRVERHLRDDHRAQLAADVRDGLTATPKHLAPEVLLR